MSVNFFIEAKKTNSSSSQFGICDDPDPLKNPAYIDEKDTVKWIGIVNNPINIGIDFYPIDHCVVLFRSPKKMDNRCDGVLVKSEYEISTLQKLFNSFCRLIKCKQFIFRGNYCNLIFVELKERIGSGWVGDGRKQLTGTIQHFKENYFVPKSINIEAYICNNLRPKSNKNYAIEIQKFKDSTGLSLNVKQEINL